MSYENPVLLRACIALGGSLIFLGVMATPAQAAPQNKVTICHRSSSVKNPYVEQTVNENSIVMPNGQPTGHGLHTGPVFPAPNWGDIIPPFTYTNDQGGTSMYPGMNWDTDGQAIWNGGCEVDFTEPPEEVTTTTIRPEVTTTTSLPSTTTTRPESITTLPSTTTTTSLPGTTTTSLPGTTTTRPESTTTLPSTTTTRPESTTTLPSTATTEPPAIETPTTAPPTEIPPPLTDPGDGIEIMPPEEAEVVDPGDQVVDLGQLSVPERIELEAEVDPLAETGPNLTIIGSVGLGLLVAGWFILAVLRRSRLRFISQNFPGQRK